SMPPPMLLGARVTTGRAYLSPPPEGALERTLSVDEELESELHIWNGPEVCPAEVELFAAHDPNEMTILRFPINRQAGIQSVTALVDGTTDRLVRVGQDVQF